MSFCWDVFHLIFFAVVVAMFFFGVKDGDMRMLLSAALALSLLTSSLLAHEKSKTK